MNEMDHNDESNLDNEHLHNEAQSKVAELSLEELRYTTFAEFLAMFFFVTTVGYSAGLGLFFGIYVVLVTFAPLSGAHCNPDLTLGHYIALPRDNISFKKLIFYIIAQLLATLLAVLFKFILTEKIIAPVVPEDTTTLNAFCQELLWGGWLVFINLYVSSCVTAPSKNFLANVFVFTSCLYYNIMVTVGVTGGSLNPAIGLIGNICGLILIGDSNSHNYSRSLWISSIAPFVGGIIFSLIFRFVFEPLFIILNTFNKSKAELLCTDNSHNNLIKSENQSNSSPPKTEDIYVGDGSNDSSEISTTKKMMVQTMNKLKAKAQKH